MKKILLAIMIFSLLMSTFVVVNAQSGNIGDGASSTGLSEGVSDKPLGSTGSPEALAEIDPYPDRNRVMPKEEADLIRQFVGTWSDYRSGIEIVEMGDLFIYHGFIWATCSSISGRITGARQSETGNIEFTVYVAERNSAFNGPRDECELEITIDVSERASHGHLLLSGDIPELYMSGNEIVPAQYSYWGDYQEALDRFTEYFYR